MPNQASYSHSMNDAKDDFFTATFEKLKGARDGNATVFAVLEIESKSHGLDIERAFLLGASTGGRTTGRLSLTDGGAAHVLTDAKVLRQLERGQRIRVEWQTMGGRVMANVMLRLGKAPERGKDC